MPPWLTVVGMGEDGLDGVSESARLALEEAVEIHGGERHLAMLPGRIAALRKPWPKPFDVDAVLSRRGRPTCVLASGDPMFHGVGVVLARHVPPEEMRIFSAPSSVSLAAARLGWAVHDLEVISLLSAPLSRLTAACWDGGRFIVLSADGGTAARVASHLRGTGYGGSTMTLFESLGGPFERVLRDTAEQWRHGTDIGPLNLIAVRCVADNGTVSWPVSPGLPDEAYKHDGPLTKRDIRAVTLARLSPRPGELLWDVGAGSGSIGIEWMRSHPLCRAIAIEGHPGRQVAIEHNCQALGVPGLQIVAGAAPDALHGLPAPDAVFVGGGVTCEGVLEACWNALGSGGRLVVNAVTLQAEQRVIDWRQRHGGSLVRLTVSHAQSLGSFDTWRTALPITLYQVVKS